MRKRWTNDEWLIVITCRATGMSYKHIAKQLPGRTARQIWDRASWIRRGKQKRGKNEFYGSR